MSHDINSERITEEKLLKNQHDFSYYSFFVNPIGFELFRIVINSELGGGLNGPAL